MSALVAGMALPPITLTAGLPEMKQFSLLMADPNPIHFDPQHTAAIGMGDRPINQGTLNMAYPLNALLAVIGNPARIRSFRCRFHGTVVADDTVTAGGEVRSVDADGVAEVELWLDRGDTRVLSGVAVVGP